MVIDNLMPGTTYYFAIKVYDNVLNSPGLSNIVKATTVNGKILYSDDFEKNAPGWIRQSTNSSITWHLTTRRSKSASSSFVYNNGLTYNTYPNANSGTLTSPLLDLSLAEDAILTYSYWYNTITTNSDYLDNKRVQISTDGGKNWETIFEYSYYNYLIYWPRNWGTKVLNLSKYQGKKILIRFNFSSLNNSYRHNFEGWYVDDIKIYHAKQVYAPLP